VPTTRRAAAALAVKGARFIDAPVSGAPEVARQGKLTMMLGGVASDIEEAMPVLESLSALRVHVGPLGSGQVVKLANNLMAAAHFLVAAELVALIRRAGLDVDNFLSVINASTGRSFITERVYPHWIQRERFDLGYAMGLMRKDVRLALDEIEHQQMDLPLVRQAGEQWLDSRDLVGDDEDITRIVELPARRSRISDSAMGRKTQTRRRRRR
jgi:3-hydroxyisobutyrate dehydrogenase